MNFCVEVKENKATISGLCRPASPCISLRYNDSALISIACLDQIAIMINNLRHIIFIDSLPISNIKWNCFSIILDRQMNSPIICWSNPLCI